MESRINHRKKQSGTAFLLALFLSVPFPCARVSAQRATQDSWKSQAITLRVSNESLGAVIEKVAEAAGATVEYSGVTLVGIDRPTTINVVGRPLDKLLGQLVEGQEVHIRYEGGMPGRRQIIFESPHPDQPDTNKNFQISGAVVDATTGETLVGATILVIDDVSGEGTGKGSITDVNGKFSIRLDYKSSIRISYIGYDVYSKQILQPDNDMKIGLTPSSTNIDEVVVTGISQRKKSSFTGNYVAVEGEELRKISPNNILRALEFFDPSFKIVENNLTGSDPNARPEFRLRGDQSLGNNIEMSSMDLMLDNVSARPNTPLFVLDGFIVSINRVLELDPERVASVTILKDAASTAIYGSRASNGVVVVETVRAPDGALSVSYSGNVTVETPDLTGYNMMTAAEKLRMEWDAGLYPSGDDNLMNMYNDYRRNILAGVDTYWLSRPLRTSFGQNHSLVAGGGTEFFQYVLGVNGNFHPGVMKGSENNRIGSNLTMTYRKEKMKVGATINLSEVDGANSPWGDFSSYTSTNPYYPVRNSNGDVEQILDEGHTTGNGMMLITNPVYNATVGIKDVTKNLTVSMALNLEYSILRNLRVTEQVSYVRSMARSERFLPADHTSFAQEPDLTKRGRYTKSTGESASWSNNLGINYNLPVGKHLISTFGNWVISQDRNNYVNLSAEGYPDKHMDDFIFGNTMDTDPSGTEGVARNMSLIGQISYSYDDRYSFDFNLSGETSSRYADHRIVPFWSAGYRWNAYREEFLQGRISNLVFRTSYGVTGDQSFSPSDAIEYYSFTGTMMPYTSFANLGATLVALHNPDLSWAKTDNYSLGVDVGFWKNRVNATLNYYNNITRQLLTDYDLSPSTGFDSQVINAGELQNRGIDVTLNVIAIQDIKKRFYWSLSANANHNRNKIRKISDALRKINEAQLASTTAPLPVYQEGQSTTTLYTVQSLGIDPVTGNEVYLKRDGSKTFVWDAADKVPVGDTNPKVSGTFFSSISWKDFSANAGFSYKWGGILYNQTLVDKIENSSLAYNLDRRAAESRWMKVGDVTMYKKLIPDGDQTPQSSRFIMDDNELSLSSLSFGYRFTHSAFNILERLNINVLNLNFTTNDLLRLSSVRRERGLSYPFTRSYTLSMSVIFK